MNTKQDQINSQWKGKIVAFLLGIVIFMGMSSVLASWPDAPDGESFGGWLGRVFNLENSGSGQLILSSKKIILPEDSSPVLENKQVATKEYVDSQVGAYGGGLGTVGPHCISYVTQCPPFPHGYSLVETEEGDYKNCCYLPMADEVPQLNKFVGLTPGLKGDFALALEGTMRDKFDYTCNVHIPGTVACTFGQVFLEMEARETKEEYFRVWHWQLSGTSKEYNFDNMYIVLNTSNKNTSCHNFTKSTYYYGASYGKKINTAECLQMTSCVTPLPIACCTP